MEFFRELGRKHEALKNRIHNTRIPLGPRGVFIMKLVYITTPIIIGGLAMEGVKAWRAKQVETDPKLIEQRERIRQQLHAMQAEEEE